MTAARPPAQLLFGFGCPQLLYGRFKKDHLANKELIGMLGPVIGFAGKKESAGCQAADLLLMGAIRQERTEHGAEPSDISKSSFADVTQPIDMEDVATFRIPTTPDVLVSLRENMFVDAALRRAWEGGDERHCPSPSNGNRSWRRSLETRGRANGACGAARRDRAHAHLARLVVS